MSAQPIGIFDSGVGGLTVAQSIIEHCPEESIIYFGDTAHLPYGEKSIDALREYAQGIVRFLIEQDCKCIVVACNTAWAAAGDLLLQEYGYRIPIINVVDPTVSLIRDGDYETLGLIATRATIETGMYRDRVRALQRPHRLRCMATPLLVHIVEEGYAQHEIARRVLEGYFAEHPLGEVDALILACTHFPILRDQIACYFNPAVDILEPSDALARYLRQFLIDEGLAAPAGTRPSYQYYVSDYTDAFLHVVRSFYKHPVTIEGIDIWNS